MNIDTRVTVINFKARQIGGIIAPFADAQHKSRAGSLQTERDLHAVAYSDVIAASPLDGYDGHYVTRQTVMLTPAEGIAVYVDHHYDLGLVGYLTHFGHEHQGVAIKAQLLPYADTMRFEREDRTLPKLLLAGKLYWCPDFADPDLAPDGFLRSAKLMSVNLTEHPGTPKASKS